MTTVLQTGLLSPQRRYLLALSGGRDSVCLLHLLLESGIRKLHLVHLNHQLRGEESEADAHFVTKLAQELNLPLTLEKAAVAKLAEDCGKSLEAAAREARHQLFAKVAHETGCSRVLLAHHADDQAETCLFNLLRGSAGLKGMAAESPFQVDRKTLTLLRPLLHTRRAQIDHYLSHNNLPFRDDSTNADPEFTRNRIRHEALPLLTDILQRDIVPPILRASEISRENELIITEIIESLELLDPQGRIFLPKFRNLSPSLQQACLKNYFHRHQIPQISKALLERALELISPDGPASFNLPSNRYLRRKEGRIFII